MANEITFPREKHNYDFSALDLADISEITRLKYRRTWEAALAAGIDLSDPAQVIPYAQSLPLTARRYLSAMMKIQTKAAMQTIKTSQNPLTATPEKVAKMQVLIWQLEALQETIKIQEEKGKKIHTWLSQKQVEQLTAMPFQVEENPQVAMRDYIVLAVLCGAGVRREEGSLLTFDAFKEVPADGEIRDVIQIMDGKGEKDRVILISPTLAQHVKEWQTQLGGGRVFRSVNKANKIGKSLSVRGIFDIVRKYGALIGKPKLDPHDLRRTFGRLVYEETRDIKFVCDLLGHDDVKTTMRYIGLDLNLDRDPRNFVIRERKDFFMPVSGD